MDNSKAAIFAAVIAFIIGVLFGYNLHGKNINENGRAGDHGDQTFIDTSRSEKEYLILRDQLQNATRDNEILNDQIISLKAQISPEGPQSDEGCKTSLEMMEGKIAELEKENREAVQVLNRIRSLIPQEKK